MARTVAGTLTLPVVGSPLANAEIFFTAKRTEATAILKGVSTSFKTDSSGAYSASIVNGYYAVSVSYSLPGVSQARRYPLGDVVVSDGGTVTLNALLAVSESTADPVDEALLQLLADAQQARDEAVAAAATLQYSTEQDAKDGTSLIGIMSPRRVWQAIAQWALDQLRGMAFLDKATQAQQLAGDSDSVGTTPLGVKRYVEQYGLGATTPPDKSSLQGVRNAVVNITSGDFGDDASNIVGNALVLSVSPTRSQAFWTSGHPNYGTRILYKSTNDNWETDSGVVELWTDANFNPDTKAPRALESYTVATAPSASASARQMIYISNESGGPVPAFSDGTNWRRVTDRQIIS